VFIRWAQVGAFSPLMENGGDGEHRPWIFDNDTGNNETTEIYADLVNTHLSLAPYLYQSGNNALTK
jgi:alpha-glucosidase (family GH31 glycosyl hydrolase)